MSDDNLRIAAAVCAYDENMTGLMPAEKDHLPAMIAALEAADRVGGPHLERVARVEKKLSNLRAVAVAAQSQIEMLLGSLDDVSRAVAKIKPSAPVDDPATMCSLSGESHVHPDDGSDTLGRCPVHPDAPGDL
jgi:hypothetical protein